MKPNFYSGLERKHLNSVSAVKPYGSNRDRTAKRMSSKTIIFPASTDAKLIFKADDRFLRVTFRNIGANYAAIGHSPNTAYDNCDGLIFGAAGGPPAQGEQIIFEATEDLYIQTPSGTTLSITTEATE